MPRSLKVRQDCIGIVKLAVRRNGFPSQQALAEELNLARSTVVNFLTGKPVDRAVFEEICEKLSVDSNEVAELGFETPSVSAKETQMELTRSYGDLREAPDISAFHGRRQELATLEHWILQEKCRLIALLGVGGIGKTALSVKFAKQVQERFEYIIWRSVRNAPPPEEILTELIQFLAPKQEASLPETLDGLVSPLLDHLRQHRCLVILDNYESILQEGVYAGEYRSGYESYTHLLRCIGEVHHQSCVVLTSREKPREVVQMEGSKLPVRSLQLSSLDEEYKIFETEEQLGRLSAVEAQVMDFVFYVERPPIEERCYSEILKPGCLLRIKAPWQTGKTELMSRLINYVEQKGYRTVVLNLRDATQEDFTNLDKFLQWFCTIFADRLELTTSVEEHWRKSIGNSKIKCRSYFEKYLLPGDSPLALALDEVDRIFPIREIASEFLGMLRTWHEDAKTRQLWRQLRLVVLHSEIYTEVDINQSPFNAGCEMALTDFNQEQVLDLAQRYGLEWDTARVTQLMAMVGGHPYLVGEALKQIAQQDTTLEELLQTSHTARGVYSRHLERHWRNLQSNPKLACAFQKIVLANTPVEFNSQLNQSMAVKLNDLGLVKLSSNNAIPRYELYRQYFRDRFQDNL